MALVKAYVNQEKREIPVRCEEMSYIKISSRLSLLA
jgi:hypothetical protein